MNSSLGIVDLKVIIFILVHYHCKYQLSALLLQNLHLSIPPTSFCWLCTTGRFSRRSAVKDLSWMGSSARRRKFLCGDLENLGSSLVPRTGRRSSTLSILSPSLSGDRWCCCSSYRPGMHLQGTVFPLTYSWCPEHASCPGF